jgi:outer membrane receptor protein involved in Fe transport
VDIINYEDYDSQDSDNHTAFGGLELNFPGALFVKLEEVYQDTSDYATSELDKRDDRRQNNGDASIGFVFSDDFRLQLDYISEYHKYESSTYENFNRFGQEFGPAVYIRFLPKTSALVEYHYGIIDYSDVDSDLEDNSSTFHQVMGGLQWEMTGKSTGTLKAGYQWKEYDEDYGLEDGKKVKKNDKDTWVVSSEMEVEFTPKTSANLLLKRSIVESTFTNNSYYVENLASLGFTQKLLEKVSLSTGLAYYYNRYHRKAAVGTSNKRRKRKDKIFDGSVGLEYRIQEWLMVGASYKYKDRESNSSTHSYTDSQGTAYVKVAF